MHENITRIYLVNEKFEQQVNKWFHCVLFGKFVDPIL